MPKITKIEPQKRKGRFNIYLDGKFLVGVSEDVIITFDLKEGLEIDPKRIKEFEKKEEETKVYNAALRFLSYRLRSEKEVINKLRAKRLKERVIKKIIQRLKKEKLLDDEEFARIWLKNRELLKPTGRRLLFWELKQKGVEEKIIKKILEEDYNQDKEIALAKEAALQKKRVYQNLPREESRQKMIGFLQRRGFSWETVKKVLEEICDT